ncbi:MAG: preprotein translocase subunit SecE [Candidatus Magasanikbacteria bacterium]|nr:preprotein translocase subunit SecE [Candidatus Magasanikbacteria bacterium]
MTQSFGQQITEYFKGANEELRKVIWPTKNETVRLTVAVIAVSLSAGVFFWVLDAIFNYALSTVLK